MFSTVEGMSWTDQRQAGAIYIFVTSRRLVSVEVSLCRERLAGTHSSVI